MKIGDRFEIHCYKHDGSINQISDNAEVVDIKKDFIVCINNCVKITDSDGKSYYTREPAILFFYKKRWFNIIAQIKKDGLFYYCNIGTPYIIDDNAIKYIDYDLDLRVFPDGSFKVLDKNEYKYHKSKMKYPPEIDNIVNKELETLINMNIHKEGPFKKEVIDYYKKFINVMKKNS